MLGSYHPVTSGAWVEEGNYCPGRQRLREGSGWQQSRPQHCKQMGESELEWMAVTSGGMNVCHSTFLLSLGWQKAVGHMYTCRSYLHLSFCSGFSCLGNILCLGCSSIGSVQQVCFGATETGQLFSDSLCLASHPNASQGYLSSFGSGKTVAPVVLGSYHPVTSGAWVEEGNYCPQVLPFMWRAHLPLACRLQGWHRVANLAGKD